MIPENTKPDRLTSPQDTKLNKIADLYTLREFCKKRGLPYSETEQVLTILK